VNGYHDVHSPVSVYGRLYYVTREGHPPGLPRVMHKPFPTSYSSHGPLGFVHLLVPSHAIEQLAERLGAPALARWPDANCTITVAFDVV
jgi:hypothetical protein